MALLTDRLEMLRLSTVRKGAMILHTFRSYLLQQKQRFSTAIMHDLCHQLTHQVENKKTFKKTIQYSRWFHRLIVFGADPDVLIDEFNARSITGNLKKLKYDLTHLQSSGHSRFSEQEHSFPTGFTVYEFSTASDHPALMDVFLKLALKDQRAEPLLKLIQTIDRFEENLGPGYQKPEWHSNRRARIEACLLEISERASTPRPSRNPKRM